MVDFDKRSAGFSTYIDDLKLFSQWIKKKNISQKEPSSHTHFMLFSFLSKSKQ